MYIILENVNLVSYIFTVSKRIPNWLLLQIKKLTYLKESKIKGIILSVQFKNSYLHSSKSMYHIPFR